MSLIFHVCRISLLLDSHGFVAGVLLPCLTLWGMYNLSDPLQAVTSPAGNRADIVPLLPLCACITFDIIVLKMEFHDWEGSCPHCPVPL